MALILEVIMAMVKEAAVELPLGQAYLLALPSLQADLS